VWRKAVVRSGALALRHGLLPLLPDSVRLAPSARRTAQVA
jgi:hypothetical protein